MACPGGSLPREHSRLSAAGLRSSAVVSGVGRFRRNRRRDRCDRKRFSQAARSIAERLRSVCGACASRAGHSTVYARFCLPRPRRIRRKNSIPAHRPHRLLRKMRLVVPVHGRGRRRWVYKGISEGAGIIFRRAGARLFCCAAHRNVAAGAHQRCLMKYMKKRNNRQPERFLPVQEGTLKA